MVALFTASVSLLRPALTQGGACVVAFVAVGKKDLTRIERNLEELVSEKLDESRDDPASELGRDLFGVKAGRSGGEVIEIEAHGGPVAVDELAREQV